MKKLLVSIIFLTLYNVCSAQLSDPINAELYPFAILNDSLNILTATQKGTGSSANKRVWKKINIGTLKAYINSGGGGIGPVSPDVSLGLTTTSTDNTITNTSGTGVTLSSATTTVAGLLSAADKVKVNTIANKHPLVTFFNQGSQLGTPGTVDQINFTGTGVTAVRTSNTIDVTINSTGGGSGSSITTYNAGNGCIVTATGAGVSFVRTTASLWAMTIPSGVELLSFDINSTISQSSTAGLDIDFVFQGTRIYNQSTAMTDLKVPVIIPLRKGTPVTYPTTSAGTNTSWSCTITIPGTLRLSTSTFTNIGQGTLATDIKGTF